MPLQQTQITRRRQARTFGDLLLPHGGVKIVPSAVFHRPIARSLRKDAFRNASHLSIYQSLIDIAWDNHSSGNETVERIKYALRLLTPPPQEHQNELHDQFLRAALPKIYGDEWSMVATQMAIKYGVTKIEKEILVVMPRRWGKTVAVAMFAAACLLCIPDTSIIIFSTGQRTAALLMRSINSTSLDTIRPLGGPPKLL